MEEHYFKNSDYMIGNSLTVADLAAYFEFQSLVVVDFDFGSWVKVAKWMEKVGQIKEVREANHNFMRLLPKIKPKKGNL